MNSACQDSPQITLAAPGQVPLHSAQALMKGGQIACIELNGQIYTLRITRAGKLILTK